MLLIGRDPHTLAYSCIGSYENCFGKSSTLLSIAGIYYFGCDHSRLLNCLFACFFKGVIAKYKNLDGTWDFYVSNFAYVSCER